MSHLPALLKMMLGSGAGLPRTNVSGHDPSFFHRKWGTITGDYESACRECSLKPWAGTSSKKEPRAQPREIDDVLLHETVVSWLRREGHKTALAHCGWRHRWSWSIACAQLPGTSTQNLMSMASRCNYQRVRTLAVADGVRLRT